MPECLDMKGVCVAERECPENLEVLDHICDFGNENEKSLCCDISK